MSDDVPSLQERIEAARARLEERGLLGARPRYAPAGLGALRTGDPVEVLVVNQELVEEVLSQGVTLVTAQPVGEPYWRPATVTGYNGRAVEVCFSDSSRLLVGLDPAVLRQQEGVA